METSTKECGEMIHLKALVQVFISVGTFTYANGNRYEGEWKNGKKERRGIQLLYECRQTLLLQSKCL
jgi:hypothetical protein